jgi:ribosomal protein S18 acetylase RimI-like enzyme
VSVEVVYRTPSVEEFVSLTTAVGFKPHPPEAVRIGLENTWCAVCAVVPGKVVGLGRVLGDGALHFYLANIMVAPAHQRHGIGSAMVRALLLRVNELPYDIRLVPSAKLLIS